MNPPRRPADYEEEFEDTPLTPDENRRMRRLLRDEDRARWFWRTVRIWLGWIAGGLVSAAVIASALKDGLKGLAK